MKKKQSKLKIAAMIIAAVICVALTASLIPIFASYNDSERLLLYIESFGVWGAFVLLAIQVFQVVFAWVPGELVEFVAGVLYGPLLGTVICIVGVLIGEALVFGTIRRLSIRHPEQVKIPQKLENLKFLKDEKKLEYIIFLLFFIPGTPKDLLCYFVPLTKIDLRRFLVLSCFARIPSVLSSAFAGETFADGDFFKTLFIYAAIGVVSLIGIFVHNRFMNKGERHGGK